ncbi:MAG TPA: thiamine pyrophosphate-dependent enzyme, partial [Burkholderiales bacterium]|nr:thiamine pyrophosphate-dependent enzyme [Burkholderiales bacterium]
EALGAAVYQEPVPYNARFPATHRANMGDLTRNQKKVRETLSRHDLVICLGADLLRMSPYSPTDPLPDRMAVVHVSERDWELGKNYPTELAIRADVKETLRALLPLVKRLRTAEYAAQAEQRLHAMLARNWSAQREAARRDVPDTAPADPRYVAMCLADVLPADAIVVEEAVSSAAALSSFLATNAADSFYGLASGGLGFAMAGAIGISLAKPGRPVVAAVGDGSAMYTIQALWTAAHLQVPVTYVIYNNRGYRIIKERLVANRGSERFVGMDLKAPEVDFVGIARGFGMPAHRASAPRDLKPMLEAAIASRMPCLIEVMVDDGFGNV